MMTQRDDFLWQFCLTVGFFLALPSTAWAQSGSDANAQMLELNEQGFSAFDDGDYLGAAQKFEAAHDQVPDPILRKNAAIAWFKAERCVEASEAAVFFLLAEGTQRQDRDEARAVWAHCRLDEAAEAFDAGELDRAGDLIARVHVIETDKKVVDRLTAARMRLIEARVAESDGGFDRSSVGWALVGVGSALIVGTAVYHASADGQGDVAKWAVPALYGTGVVGVVGGFSLVMSSGGRDAQQRKEPVALRAPAPAAVEIGWSLRF